MRTIRLTREEEEAVVEDPSALEGVDPSWVLYALADAGFETPEDAEAAAENAWGTLNQQVQEGAPLYVVGWAQTTEDDGSYGYVVWYYAAPEEQPGTSPLAVIGAVGGLTLGLLGIGLILGGK